MKNAIIRKGKHRSNLSFPIPHIGKKMLSYQIIFTDSCKYELSDGDQLDINKLFGLSFGNHHKNSARFGWRWNSQKEKIELLAYVYVDGKRINEWDQNILIADVDLNVELKIDLLVLNKSYYFSIEIGDNSFFKEIKYNKIPNWGYNLYPYFGGNQVAPHDIVIKYKKPY